MFFLFGFYYIFSTDSIQTPAKITGRVAGGWWKPTISSLTDEGRNAWRKQDVSIHARVIARFRAEIALPPFLLSVPMSASFRKPKTGSETLLCLQPWRCHWIIIYRNLIRCKCGENTQFVYRMYHDEFIWIKKTKCLFK